MEPDALRSSSEAARMAYPQGTFERGMLRASIFAWRLGLGTLLGHRFVLVTTRGRRSGLPRRSVLEYGALRGKLYVISGFGSQADWHKDLCDDPYVMIQTWQGPEPMQVRCVTDEGEMRDVCALFMRQSPVILHRYLISPAIRPDSIEEVMAHKDRLVILRFDPTDEGVPPPLKADLVWMWPLLAAVLGGLAWGMCRRHKCDED